MVLFNFFINSEQRPETDVIGGGQGDHTTAYTAIIQAILSSTGSMGIESAIESLKEFGQIVLKGDGKDRFCAIKKPEVHSEDFRNKVKRALKSGATNIISWGELRFISRALKDNKINKLSEYLCDLTTCLLEEIQQSQAAYYSKGRIDKDSNEGNIVKAASRALLTLDKLCRLCDLVDDKKFQKELGSFLSSLAPKKKDDDSTEEDHVVRYGLNILNKETVGLTGDDETDKKSNVEAINKAAKKTEEFAKKLKDAKTIAAQRTILYRIRDQLLSDPGKIAGFMGDLFDYKQKIVFDLKTAASLTDKEKKGTPDARLQLRKEKFQRYLNPEGNQDDYEFEFSKDEDAADIVIVTRKNDKKLIETIDKHLKITWGAFPYLSKHLDKQVQHSTVISTAPVAFSTQSSTKKTVENVFLNDEVLEKQGWKNGKYFDLSTNDEINLSTDYLRQGIQEVRQKAQIIQSGGRL